jgi:hypothetical protein
MINSISFFVMAPLNLGQTVYSKALGKRCLHLLRHFILDGQKPLIVAQKPLIVAALKKKSSVRQKPLLRDWDSHHDRSRRGCEGIRERRAKIYVVSVKRGRHKHSE